MSNETVDIPAGNVAASGKHGQADTTGDNADPSALGVAQQAYQLLCVQLAEALRQQGACDTLLGKILSAQTSDTTRELALVAERLRGLQNSLSQNLRVSVQRLESIRPVVYLRGDHSGEGETSGKDPLTGVADRDAFERLLELEAARFSRYSTPFSLALLDIDHFRSCNEKHGRTLADDVLRCYANNLSLICRKNDMIARLDGDRFGLIFANTNCAGAMDAMAKAQKLLSQVSLPQALKSILLPSYSAGIAGCRPGEGVVELVGRAQAALQRAKDSGRNRIESDE